MKPIRNLIRWHAVVLLALLASPAFTIAAFAITGVPSVITYHDWSGEVRIYAFVEGDRHTLVVNFWSDNSGTWQWQWADMGVPSWASSIQEASAITYRDAAGVDRIDVFATDNNHLVVNYCVATCDDTSTWHWADQGTM